MHAVLGQIVDITGLETEPSIDCTIYQTGTVINVSYIIPWSELTPEEKIIVESFSALIISLAPTE